MDIIIEVILSLMIAMTFATIFEYLNRRMLKSKNNLKLSFNNHKYNLDISNTDEAVQEIISHTSKPKIFFDYSFKNQDFAERLAGDLEKNGLRTWLADKEIYAGDKLLPKIEEGLRTSGYFLAIVSKPWLESDWTKKELEMALKRQEKGLWPNIIPILIEDVELPNYIKDRKYVDFRNNYEIGVEKIVETIQRE